MSKINCHVIHELLPLYVDRALGMDASKEVEEHLENCQHCREEYNHFQEEEKDEFYESEKQVDYLKKYRNHRNRLWTIVCVLVIFIIVTGIFLFVQLFEGKTSKSIDINEYSRVKDSGVYSPLVVFPDSEIPSGEYYYLFKDEIFSPTCQIYLNVTYSEEKFNQEKERLESLELSYLGDTNKLYIDEKHYIATAYVALANWDDRFEYAVVLEHLNTIVYVYLQNIDREDLYMHEMLLPSYFRNDNAGEYSKDNMDEEHQSFYAFRIGNQYIDCMDLVE